QSSQLSSTKNELVQSKENTGLSEKSFNWPTILRSLILSGFHK
ncbi:2340_t:CDS:1, partial [Gigaspora rosea]